MGFRVLRMTWDFWVIRRQLLARDTAISAFACATWRCLNHHKGTILTVANNVSSESNTTSAYSPPASLSPFSL